MSAVAPSWADDLFDDVDDHEADSAEQGEGACFPHHQLSPFVATPHEGEDHGEVEDDEANRHHAKKYKSHVDSHGAASFLRRESVKFFLHFNHNSGAVVCQELLTFLRRQQLP